MPTSPYLILHEFDENIKEADRCTHPKQAVEKIAKTAVVASVRVS